MRIHADRGLLLATSFGALTPARGIVVAVLLGVEFWCLMAAAGLYLQ